MKKWVVFLGLVLGVSAFAEPSSFVDFSQIPPAASVEQSRKYFDERAELVINHMAYDRLGTFNFQTGGWLPVAAIGRLAWRIDVATVNDTFLDSNAEVYSRVGSDFHEGGPFCQRTGDYDFMLHGLVTLMYHFGDDPLLIWPSTRTKILYKLLSQRGGADRVHTHNNLWMCGVWTETENHILMTESSRYLTNQLLLRELRRKMRYNARFDNEANGMNEWMLKHLSQFTRYDFSEYNSKPYQPYALESLSNLYEFAEDARVKLAAEIVLNYCDAKYAVSSINLRRWAPFRRQLKYNNRTDLFDTDSESVRFALLAGNTQVLADLPKPYQLSSHIELMLPWALGSYRTPELVLDLMLQRSIPRFQAFHHRALEIYAGSKNFLISGGGIHIPWWFFTHENDGWAMPTSVIPAKGGLDGKDFIRFLGHNDRQQRANMCVMPGFACGLNPVIPDSIPASCIERRGNWSFVDFTSEQCPLKYDFFTAVYTAPCDSRRCSESASNFGFLEAAEPRVGFGYAEFRDAVLAKNGNRHFSSQGVNDYVLASSDQLVQFSNITANEWEWNILSFGGYFYNRETKTWPLAWGHVLNANGDGLVTIDNFRLRRRLVLDYRDSMNPRREMVTF